MPYTYEYPRAALAVDCVVFGLDIDDLKVLLIQRRIPPFQHAWALPGGFVRLDETLDAAARRELSEEAGVTDVYLEQLYSFSDLERDPRGPDTETRSRLYGELVDAYFDEAYLAARMAQCFRDLGEAGHAARYARREPNTHRRPAGRRCPGNPLSSRAAKRSGPYLVAPLLAQVNASTRGARWASLERGCPRCGCRGFI